MPKVEFETEEEFDNWIKEISKSRKYSLYVVAEKFNVSCDSVGFN